MQRSHIYLLVMAMCNTRDGCCSRVDSVAVTAAVFGQTSTPPSAASGTRCDSICAGQDSHSDNIKPVLFLL